MPINQATLRQFLSGTALAVSVSSICYLLTEQQPAEVSISDLSMKISQIESGLATLQREHEDLKEEGRQLRVALENGRGTVLQDEEPPVADSAGDGARLAVSPHPPARGLDTAHGNPVASGYPGVVEKSQATANSMVSVLSNETSIPKDKLLPMKDVFSEASIRIAHVLTDARAMNDVQGLHGRISEINQWKDDALAALLSKEEFDQYKSINWMKKLGPGDRK